MCNQGNDEEDNAERTDCDRRRIARTLVLEPVMVPRS